MIKGRREGLQILKDGSVKLTVSISKEDLSEAVNMHDLFISADMPATEVDASEVKRKCMEALGRAMEYIKGDSERPIDMARIFFQGNREVEDVRNSG